MQVKKQLWVKPYIEQKKVAAPTIAKIEDLSENLFQ